MNQKSNNIKKIMNRGKKWNHQKIRRDKKYINKILRNKSIIIIYIYNLQYVYCFIE